jgi:peroxiredoxin
MPALSEKYRQPCKCKGLPAIFVLLAAGILFIVAAVSAETPSPFAVNKVIGKKAPDVTLKDLDGNPRSLSSYKGKVVLLHFWATWCPPCRDEIPELNELNKKMSDRAFAIYAVSTDDAAVDVKDFMKKNPVKFSVVMDFHGAATKKFYKVFMMPTSFLIDRNGTIVDIFYGGQEWTEPAMIKKIEALL